MMHTILNKEHNIMRKEVHIYLKESEAEKLLELVVNNGRQIRTNKQ